MPNPRNHAPSSPSQNLRSARGVRGKPARKTSARETPSERAARKASETKDAERRAARAAKEANKHRKEAERVVEEVAEVTTGKRVVGARNNKRKKKLINAKESKKKKATQVHYNSSDSGEIESADDDSRFEPTDGADDDDDNDDDDEGGEMNSFASAYSHDSDIDNNPSASLEEGRRGSREAAEELRRSAQEGAANPLRTSDSEEHDLPPSPPARSDTRAIVSSMPLEAPMAQKNVVRRIVLFVKNTLFRQIKFVTSTKSFHEAFQKVLVEERPRNPYIFQLTYQNCFKTALNQKRSTCELSGKKIVIKAINTVFKNCEEEFFTFDELCKLRQATTDRERRAFFWFFDSFLECVCGASVWNNAKTKQLVSEARDPSGSKVVSVSDEAFALLLIDNYLEKWKTRADEEEAIRVRPVGDGAAAMTTGGENTIRKQTKTAGKYTGKAQGQCKWGGWSSEGIKQFNFLRKLVKADREADKNCEDEPKRMEKLLMDFCRTKAGIKDPQDDENLDGAGDGAHNNAAARAKATEPVEADWDSDDD